MMCEVVHLGTVHLKADNRTHKRIREGADVVRIFFGIFHIFLYFLGRSLSVMFKRKHLNRTLHLN